MYYDWYSGEPDYISRHSTDYFEQQYYSKSHRLMEKIIRESSLNNTVPINIDTARLRQMLDDLKYLDE